VRYDLGRIVTATLHVAVLEMTIDGVDDFHNRPTYTNASDQFMLQPQRGTSLAPYGTGAPKEGDGM